MHGLKVSLNWVSNVLRPPESVLRKSLNVAIREQQRQQQKKWVRRIKVKNIGKDSLKSLSCGINP